MNLLKACLYINKEINLMIDDSELLYLVKNGDIRVFDELYNRYSGKLLNFIYKMVFDRMTAEDIMQDTFVKAFQNADKYDSQYRFSTWLYRIAANLSINEINKRKVRLNKKNFLSIENEEESNNPSRKVLKDETNQNLLSALSRLSVNHRAVLVMKFFQDLSYNEIAEILNISTGTVKSRIHYGIESLKSNFRE